MTISVFSKQAEMVKDIERCRQRLKIGGSPAYLSFFNLGMQLACLEVKELNIHILTWFV
jgi:hypothetical protein